MKVKGIAIKTTRDFVKIKFPNRYNEWIKTLPEESKKLYEDAINVSDWYDVKSAYYEPMNKIIEMFFEKNASKGGDEIGRFSAEIALTGVYKVFLLIATPQYLMKKASRMMETYYNPSNIEVSEVTNKQALFKINKFDGITKTTEFRFAGWCVKALELCKCKNINYKITSHLSSGQPFTAIEFKWE